MAVLRQNSYNAQQRVDVPHLRSIESAICADFDVLAGIFLTGKSPIIVKGFTIAYANTVGTKASSLVLSVAGGLVLHYGASDNGTLFSVPETQTAETLSSTNPNVTGSFAANSSNYIGIDLVRSADDSTSDIVKFWNVDINDESRETLPLARTLNYRIVISNQNFTSSSNVAPIAIVQTDFSNNVVSITDTRNLMFRLGSGGDNADTNHAYSWGSRTENSIIYNSSNDVNPFVGEDKSLNNFKSWADAVMSRLWELGSGEHWYSPTNRDSVKIAYGQPVLVSSGDNFEWVSGTNTLNYSGITVVFTNSSSAYYNSVTAGSQVLNADGQCLYVDLNRTTNGASLTAKVASLETLGVSSTPGNRFVIAWRQNGNIYARDRAYEVGRDLLVASTSNLGVVKLNNDPGNSTDPLVPAIGANGELDVDATANNGHAIKGTANGTGDGVQGAAGGGGYGLRALSGGVKLDAGSVNFADGTTQNTAGITKVLSGQARHGDIITFSPAFSSTPKVMIWGGMVQLTSATNNVYEDFGADSLSTTGFTVRARLRQTGAGTDTPQSIDAAVPANSLTTVGSSTPSNPISPAPGKNDLYTINYSGSVSVSFSGGTTGNPYTGTAAVSIAIDVALNGTTFTNNIATHSYSAADVGTSGGAHGNVNNFSDSINVTVSGVTTSTVFRIRVTSFSFDVEDSNGNPISGGSGSFSAHLASPGAVTYNTTTATTTYTSKTPNTGDVVYWMATGR